MAQIGRISTIERKGSFAPDTMAGALQSARMTRAPKTKMIMYPAKNLDGSYRTGLDPNASYIDKLSEEEQELERSRVSGFLKLAKDFYPDIDLGPRASFWKDMVKRSGQADVAPVANLVDGHNFYDFSNPQALIVYAYLRVHPMIAPSGQAVLSGKYGRANYYVNDYDVEAALTYKLQTKISKATSQLDAISLDKRKAIARQLGLNISDDAKEESVYVLLYNYINDSHLAKKAKNVDLFTNLVDMSDENLMIVDTVDQALRYNVLRANKGLIYRGDVQVAKSQKEYGIYLCDPENQEDLIAIKEELKLKKTLKALK